MKKVKLVLFSASILLATTFIFSCTSTDSSPESPPPGHSSEPKNPLEEPNGYHLVSAENFRNEYFWNEKHGGSKIVFENPYNTGIEVTFSPDGKEAYIWDLQLRRDALNMKANHSYKLEFGGYTIEKGASATVTVSLMKCTSATNCVPYNEWDKIISTSDYKEYEVGTLNTCGLNDDPNAVFTISGGHKGNKKFRITWLSVYGHSINCP
ncbi:MAG: hypothetical protein LBH25_04505 [Fibromonadaceae bacterium]|jgi:hypothetical protein|nr:hypothetical protein [Fibromonadaceae bacterium]